MKTIVRRGAEGPDCRTRICHSREQTCRPRPTVSPHGENSHDRPRRGRHRGDHQLHEHEQSVGDAGGRVVGEEGGRQGAERAAAREDQPRPGSRVVTDYLAKAGVTAALEQLGFHTVGYGCTTCIGNSGPLPDPVAQAVTQGNLVAAAVLSGNRNFEGRVNPLVKANYLASPPLVVAYALAGTVDIDLAPSRSGQRLRRPAGVPARYLANGRRDPRRPKRPRVLPEMFTERYAEALESNEKWNAIQVTDADLYDWDPNSTYIQEPPFLVDLTAEVRPIQPIRGARVLAVLGDSVTTDHISPAGSIAKDSPAGKYLIAHQVEPRDFNSYGSRRGNDRVMIRGTFANIRIRNHLAPGTEGGVTRHLPDGQPMSDLRCGREVSRRGCAAGHSGRRRIRHGQQPRLGRQRHVPAGRARRDRRQLRAHPPQQSRRHGRPAARVRRRARPGSRSA